MGTEIERKFLVADESADSPGAWRQGRAVRLTQGYLAKTERSVVRIRVAGGKQAWVTIKGPTVGATRPEFEYAIPVGDAQEMLQTMCDSVIDKTRYIVEVDSHTWEVDEFYGENDGLIVAEIELVSEEEVFTRPEWAAKEVTHDARYYNSNLASQPFTTWSKPLES